MVPQTQRWFIKQEGPNPKSLRTAFAWLEERMANSSSHQGLLVVPLKKTLENIKGALGEEVVKILTKNNAIQLKSGRLDLMTGNMRPASVPSSILVLYPPQRLLDSVDELQTASEILVVPWSLSEVEPWIQMWSARELGDLSPSAIKVFSNPTVRAALESLTNRINLSTGLSHPLDEAAAIDMFQLLHEAGETFDPPEVRAWLISKLNWRPQQADTAVEIAQNILAGKLPRSASSTRWANGIVSRWREEGARYSD
jgi:hypothetical protein